MTSAYPGAFYPGQVYPSEIDVIVEQILLPDLSIDGRDCVSSTRGCNGVNTYDDLFFCCPPCAERYGPKRRHS